MKRRDFIKIIGIAPIALKASKLMGKTIVMNDLPSLDELPEDDLSYSVSASVSASEEAEVW